MESCFKKKKQSLPVLPNDVLGIVYSELRLRKDVVSFKLVCKQWYKVAFIKNIVSNRWLKQRLTCSIYGSSFSKWCCKIGEFECGVCFKPNGLCKSDANVFCIRCQKRLCPKCCRYNIPVCIMCIEKCELCGKYIPISNEECWDRRFDVNNTFHFCSTCNTIACYRCHYDKSNCFLKKHEYQYVCDWFQHRIINPVKN